MFEKITNNRSTIDKEVQYFLWYMSELESMKTKVAGNTINNFMIIFFGRIDFFANNTDLFVDKFFLGKLLNFHCEFFSSLIFPFYQAPFVII